LLNSAYFTTESYPVHQRLSAWRGTLERLSLHVRNVAAEGAVHGTVSSAVSPHGLTFARISAGPQELSYQDATRHGAICLTLHLEGEAMLVDEARQTLVDSGDIVFGPTGATGGLSLKSDFRQLLVTIPREAFRSCLPTPLSLRVGRLPGNSGIGHVFSGMLGSVADRIDQLTAAQLRPIEIALSEFLVSNLTDPDEFVANANAACARTTLHRLSRHIESWLGDPSLCVDAVAAQLGVSTRHLQKLFESVGETFTHYVRLRRLERCRADLVNPLFAHLSISDVCFRWSFSDAAHFSRAFREQYRVSPRAYRREVGATISTRVLLHANRGWPGGSRMRDSHSARLPIARRHHRLAASVDSLQPARSAVQPPAALEILSGDLVTVEATRPDVRTGPVAVLGAQPGDVLEVRILDVRLRPDSVGCHVRSDGVSLYELTADDSGGFGRPMRQAGDKIELMRRVRIPLRLHFAFIALATARDFDQNIDDVRVAKGSSLLLPVRVPGGMLSIGDSRATTAIDCALNGVFQIVVHKSRVLACPVLETVEDWILRADVDARADGAGQRSALDRAIAQAHHRLCEFLTGSRGLSSDEAQALVSVATAVDIRRTHIGWCVQAALKRAALAEGIQASGTLSG
jgi:acetamidase/formamidase/AraC-like DNA-binding protein